MKISNTIQYVNHGDVVSQINSPNGDIAFDNWSNWALVKETLADITVAIFRVVKLKP